MRLTSEERNAIKTAIQGLDHQARIFLFGSRVDDAKQGGDIDLFVLSQKLSLKDTPKILATIFRTLEEQKIDLVITDRPRTAFEKHIYQESIEL